MPASFRLMNLLLRSVAMMSPPSIGLGSLRHSRNEAVLPIEAKSVVTTGTVKAVASENNWKVPDNLPSVPEHWVLERTSRFVEHTKSSVVAQRVARCLQQRSVSSVFNGPKAKAKCITDELVEFRIRLFSGKGNYSHGTVIEVQKRSGSSMLFKEECNAVLNAAEGEIVQVVKSLPKSRSFLKLGPSFMESCREDSSFSLESAFSMVRNENPDARLLGLESLVHLTDCNKSSKSVSSFVSESVLLGKDYSELRRTLVSMVQESKLGPEDQANLDPLDFGPILRANALIVLSNSLACVMAQEKNAQALATGLFFAEDLVPILTAQLKNANLSPRNAVQCIKCLSSLAQASGDHASAIQSEIHDVLAAAADYGNSYHQSLAFESIELARKLQGVR